MGAMAPQITSLTLVYSIVYSDADQRKHRSSASLAFVWGIHRRPVNSPHKWPVTRKMFPFDDVIMGLRIHVSTKWPQCGTFSSILKFRAIVLRLVNFARSCMLHTDPGRQGIITRLSSRSKIFDRITHTRWTATLHTRRYATWWWLTSKWVYSRQERLTYNRQSESTVKPIKCSYDMC